MRVLVLSDVHGNLHALEAVLAEPNDLVICLGDIVGFGPDPAGCVRRLRRAGAVAGVQGNHDRSWAGLVASGAPPALAEVADAVREELRSDLDVSDLAYLEVLPTRADVALDGIHTLLTHAAPSDPLRANVPRTTGAWTAELAVCPPIDLLLVGHTHVQFELSVGGTRVVNPGSVGLPNDGEPTAAYAVMEDGEVTLKRVPYDVAACVERLRSRGLADEIMRPLVEWFQTGRMRPTLLGYATGGTAPAGTEVANAPPT